ncbi:GumC family protein [Yoonia sp. 2307UL14-13]|uniref:GumC family protein n=1 Tax=Yoonia sp. 2307UL14-13 TaxID=3126506 RepID=UPI0030B1C694
MTACFDRATTSDRRSLTPDAVPIEPFDFAGLFRVIWRGKLIIVAVTLLTVMMAGYYAFAIAKPQFAAVTMLKIDAGSLPVADGAQTVGGLPVEPASLKTEVAVLRSPHLMRRVVDELDLLSDPAFNRYLTPIAPWSMTGMRNRLRSFLTGVPEDPPDQAAILEKTAQNVAASVNVDTLRDTLIFRITATTGDPDSAARIADTLAAVYLADQVAAKEAATDEAFVWLSERVAQLQRDLQGQETTINTLVTAHRADDIGALDALSRQAVEAADRLDETERTLIAAQATLARRDTAATPAALRPSVGRARLRADADRLAAQVASLKTFHEGIVAQRDAQSAYQLRLQQVRREAGATRVLYETYLARLQQVGAQRGPQSADSRILSPAIPGTYVAPRKMLILVMAGIVGLCLGTALALIRGALRPGFETAAQLSRATRLPVLAEIPRPRSCGLDQIADHDHVVAMRDLRTSLMLDRGKAPGIILSTAVTDMDSAHMQAAGLAQAFAGLDKSVLLMATRDDPLSDGHRDLEGVIAGLFPLSDAIRRDPRLPVDILSCKVTHSDRADLFSTDRFAGFIRNLKAQYDVIIIAAPPVSEGPEARLLARLSNAVIYAVHAETNDRRSTLTGLDALHHAGANIVGLTFVSAAASRRNLRVFSRRTAMVHV